MPSILSTEKLNNLPRAEQVILQMLFAPQPDIDLINSLFASQVLGINVKDDDFYLSCEFVKKQIEFSEKVGLKGVIDNNVSLMNFRNTKLPFCTSDDSVAIYFSTFHTFDYYSSQKELCIYATDFSCSRGLNIPEESKIKQYKAFQHLLDFPLPLFQNKIVKVKSFFEVKDTGILQLMAKIFDKSIQQGVAEWQAMGNVAKTNLEKIISLSKNI